MQHQEDDRVGIRAYMILLSSNRFTVPEIAWMCHAYRGTVRFWIRRFDSQGPPGLYDELRTGRPRKAGQPVPDSLNSLLNQDTQGSGPLVI